MVFRSLIDVLKKTHCIFINRNLDSSLDLVSTINIAQLNSESHLPLVSVQVLLSQFIKLHLIGTAPSPSCLTAPNRFPVPCGSVMHLIGQATSALFVC